jgi:branched-chain amino acid transport system ATP-binding protein
MSDQITSGRALEIHDLHVSYGGIEAVRGISLNVDPGRVVGLVGANGAGKSSALRAVMGLVSAEGGVSVDGTSILGAATSARAARGVAFVPEGRGVVAPMTVADNLLLGAHRQPRKVVPGRCEEVFEVFPVLRDRWHQTAGTLSGGEQQMLAVGRALMAAPDILVLDEPSMGLAPVVAAQVFAALRAVADRGTAVLVSDENARLVLRIADHVHVLRLGVVVAEGPPTDFEDQAAFGRYYFGA